MATVAALDGYVVNDLQDSPSGEAVEWSGRAVDQLSGNEPRGASRRVLAGLVAGGFGTHGTDAVEQ
jgi:hypothetical protein